jgi:hypothetical protein
MKRKSKLLLLVICLVSMLSMTSCDLWWDTFGPPPPAHGDPGPGGGPGGPGGGPGW